MATPKPNAWNPNTTTVYSSRGSAKEIPIGDYNKFIGLGWKTSAPAPAPTPTPAPSPAPSAPARDTSHKTVYRNGQATTVQAWEVPSYLQRGYTSSYVAPAPAPAPAPTPTPAPKPTVDYAGLVKKEGTIYAGERAFKDPTELGEYLGIATHEIDWGQIPIAPTIKPEVPPTVVTTDELRKDQEDEALPYVKYADSDKVFDREGNHITDEEAAGIPDFWKQVQMSSEARPEGVMTPIESIQSVFGADWQPSARITPDLKALGIYGAVRVKGTNEVFTIGPGGSLETPSSFIQKFGTLEQEGIVGEISMEEAKALGITMSLSALTSDLSTEDIGEDPTAGMGITPDMTPEEKAIATQKIRDDADAKYGITEAKKNRDDALTKLITTLTELPAKLKEAKAEEREKLEVEAKSQAIADSQTAYSESKAKYDQYINDIRFGKAPMEILLGRQAKVRSQMALQLAPLAAAIEIAQGNYDRAMESLDDFTDDWKFGMEWSLKASQMKIDMLGEDLTEAQQKSKDAAQNKINWFMEDYSRILDTQEEVKKLSLLYPEAGILISDKWDDAYRKVAPYVASEKDFERKMNNLDMALKQKELAKPYYAPTSDVAGGLTTTQLLSREKDFWNEVDAGIKILDEKGGQKWGEVWDRVKSQFPEYANEYIDQALGGSFTEGQAVGRALSKDIITKDYLRSLYTQDDLIKAAKDAGFGKLLKGGKAEAEDYLDYLMGTVDQYRIAGFSDQEILKQMQ